MRAVDTAMVLAAGRGERMRPLTDRVPKPLVPIAGRTMLDRMLDALERFGVARAVVNASHLAGHVERRLAQRARPPVRVSLERERLETGGGVRRALPHLGRSAFLVANADIVLPHAEHAFRRLEQHWDARAMDALLLVVPRARATGYAGAGDFALPPGPAGAAPLLRPAGDPRPHVFAGIQILAPGLFAGAPDGPFPLGVLYRRARRRRRLFGIVHPGSWYHVGTLEAVRDTERRLAAAAGAAP